MPSCMRTYIHISPPIGGAGGWMFTCRRPTRRSMTRSLFAPWRTPASRRVSVGCAGERDQPLDHGNHIPLTSHHPAGHPRTSRWVRISTGPLCQQTTVKGHAGTYAAQPGRQQYLHGLHPLSQALLASGLHGFAPCLQFDEKVTQAFSTSWQSAACSLWTAVLPSVQPSAVCRSFR